MKIILKPTTAEDYNAYYKIRCSKADIYWNGYTNKPDKKSFRKIYLQRLGNAPFNETESRRLYLIQLTDQNLIENVGFLQLIRRDDGIDIGYTVVEEYQRHGYATKALKLGIEMAKQFSDEIYVQIRDDNIASQGVASKCGFVKTDEVKLIDYPSIGKVALRKYRLMR